MNRVTVVWRKKDNTVFTELRNPNSVRVIISDWRECESNVKAIMEVNRQFSEWRKLGEKPVTEER